MGKSNSAQPLAAVETHSVYRGATAPLAPVSGALLLTAAGAMLPAGWEKSWTDAGWTIERGTKLQPSIALHAPIVAAIALGTPAANSTPAQDDTSAAVEIVDAGIVARASTLAIKAVARTVVPRSAFLSHLSNIMVRPEYGCRTLMSIRVDQSSTLAEQADRAAMFGIEEQIVARLARVLAPRDAMTIWLELGFGVLVQRDDDAAVRALADRIRVSIAAEPFLVAGEPFALTVSVGMALAPHGPVAEGAHPWFASAYAAQALAHRHGGNRCDGLLTREFDPMPADRVMIIREWVEEAKSGGSVLFESQAVMPIKPGCSPQYYVHAKLRDLRAPLGGVYRPEYLRLAQAGGAMVMIDRMSLFHAFQTLEHEHSKGRETNLIVPVQLATLYGLPWRWFEAELLRRKHVANRLMVQIDASDELVTDEAMMAMARLRDHGVRIVIADRSRELAQVPIWAKSPADILCVPASVVLSMSAEEFANRLSAWRVREKRLIVDGVDDIASMPALNARGIAYLCGDAIAAIGPRLDHEFASGIGAD